MKTLKFIGIAPIFDTGSALWLGQFTHIMGSTRTLDCKPFKKNHDDQLKLVKFFDWLNLDQLAGLKITSGSCSLVRFILTTRYEAGKDY